MGKGSMYHFLFVFQFDPGLESRLEPPWVHIPLQFYSPDPSSGASSGTSSFSLPLSSVSPSVPSAFAVVSSSVGIVIRWNDRSDPESKHEACKPQTYSHPCVGDYRLCESRYSRGGCHMIQGRLRVDDNLRNRREILVLWWGQDLMTVVKEPLSRCL